MHNGFIGEFLGTMILVLLGDGVVANVLLAKSKGQNSGWIVITVGWGFAVLCGVIVAVAAGSAGHLNPAVTLAFYAAGSFPAADVVPYIAAQMSGAFTGAILVYLAYLAHWKPTEDQSLKLGVFCTGPAIRNIPANCLTEIIGTFVLVFVVIAIGAKTVGATDVLGPLMVGLLVWAVGVSLGGPTGYAINPARDLGPRIAHALLPIPGKGKSDWAYAWIPVAAPITGGLIAVACAKAAGMI
ncbi:MIP/aquaporin family protein [Brucella thiophenivorans]|uniref:MIP channel family protein n=1 Tax=Brucella thiophenivorans TaxID=571255 RepID=A0A256G294_9HYPH|nr:MIP/aquaporin family protein [Brucella thiophenivorans]OYR21192.1 MIP channel family protein [Brucella thiophenivorans]